MPEVIGIRIDSPDAADATDSIILGLSDEYQNICADIPGEGLPPIFNCMELGEKTYPLFTYTTNTAISDVYGAILETLTYVAPEPVVPEPEPIPPRYTSGDTVILYTFLSDQTVLVATHESVIEEIQRRIANQQLLQ